MTKYLTLLVFLLPILSCVSCSDIPPAKEVFYLKEVNGLSGAKEIVYDFDGVLACDSSFMDDCVFCRQQQVGNSDVFYAVLPETNYVGLYNEGLGIRLFQYQQYLPTGIETSANPMVAFGEIRKQKFKAVCGELRLSLKGHDTVTALRFTDNDTLDRLWGDFVVRNVGEENQQIFALASSNGNNEVWLDCHKGVALSEDTAKVFKVMLPPGAFYRGFSMDAFCGDSLSYHIGTKNDCSIGRGKIISMPEITIP